MAFWNGLFNRRNEVPDLTPHLGSPALASVASEPIFAPRGGRSLPPNTRAPTVLGAQPQTFARGREVAALLLWTLAVFFALALASYAGEPSTAAPLPEGYTPITGENWVGVVGAAVARLFVGLVGVMSWVVPAEALLLGIPFVTGKKSNATAARLAGDILLVVIGASLVQVGWPQKLAFGKYPAGGMIGELFGEIARSLFSTAGSFLVGFALVGLILISRASFSFIALMRWIVRAFYLVTDKVKGTVQYAHEAWAEARALDRQRAEEKRLAEQPAISVPPSDEAMIFTDKDLPEVAPLVPTPSPAQIKSKSPSDPAWDEKLPLIVAEPTDAERRLEKPKRTRKKKETTEGAAEEADVLVETPIEPQNPIEPKPSSSRRKKKSEPPKEEVSVEEAIEESEQDDDEEEEQEIEESPVAITPPVEEKRPRAAAPAKKAEAPPPMGITIVDTSAALEKVEAPKETKKKPEPKNGPAFKLPPLEMLAPAPINVGPLFDEGKLRANAELLVKTLADYKVTGKVEEILPGPVVTTFEVSAAAGTKVSRVAGLADDLALALARKVRIVAPIPGKNRIGFELPNDKRSAVNLRDLVEDRRFQTLDVPLPVVLGRDIVGNPVYADLASMPHAIVAGATGAGKSVGLNVMLTSLLFRRTPEELRMLMIDPKVVELAPFDRIPHMLLPVVTDMKQASNALKWAVDEMERRYQLFADAGTKNIGTYNGWVKRVRAGEIKNPLGKAIVGKDLNGIQEVLRVRDDDPDGQEVLPENLPMIVIVIDEFADLMMQQGKEVEACVARLAQKARAAGMHVILATQRPSVDVITGMIKANFPTRIAFRVAQKIDSRTILDEQGAEHLLGKGDMLIKLNGTNDTKRVQCPWVSEEEVQEITDFLRAQGEPVYDENILKPRDEDGAAEDEDDGEQDAMYDDAVRIVAETRRCSTSWLQRKLGLGYNRAARIVETMERRGLVGPANGAKDREVLISAL